jgi:hypothetical protein
MVSRLLIEIGPEVRAIGEQETTDGANVIVLLEGDAATSARSDPGPESLQLVTEKVAAPASGAGSAAAETVTRPATRLAVPTLSTARASQCHGLQLNLIAMLLRSTG